MNKKNLPPMDLLKARPKRASFGYTRVNDHLRYIRLGFPGKFLSMIMLMEKKIHKCIPASICFSKCKKTCSNNFCVEIKNQSSYFEINKMIKLVLQVKTNRWFVFTYDYNCINSEGKEEKGGKHPFGIHLVIIYVKQSTFKYT